LRRDTSSAFLLLFFFFANLGLSFAKSKVASLTDKERTSKINAYLAEATEKQRLDLPAALIAAQNARELSLGFNEEKNITASLRIAQFYQLTGKLDTSLIIIKDVFLRLENLQNDTLLADAHHVLGINHQFTGSFELAVENYHKALNINESLGLIEESLKQLNNIGLLYSDEKEYDKALEYLEKCLRISEEHNFKKYKFFSFGNIGYIFMQQERWEEANERLEKVFALTKYQDDPLAWCTLNYLFSEIKLNIQEYKLAKKYALKASKIANEIDYSVGIIFSQRVLADIYRHEKKYKKARDLAQKTLDYLKTNSANLYLEDVMNVLYKIEYETGNYKEALDLKILLSNRRDSLTLIETKEKISNSEYKYQLLKNEKEKELLTIENNSNQHVSFLATTIAFLLGALVLFAYFAYKRSRNNNEILEEAIAAKTKELMDSNQHLAKSNEELERFAFIASHDLKTPLRDIVSFTGLLSRRLQNHEDKRVHEYLDFIKNGGIRLNSIIRDTLEYSRLSSREKLDKVESIDLNEMLDDLENSMSNYLKEKNAKLVKHGTLPQIVTNHSNLFLLLQNLFENGLKYNKSANPTIEIYTKSNADTLSIFVKDNGIGIPDEFKEEIFVMFSRLHSQNEYEGSGLGLSICKKVVEQLKGDISLQSELGKGSTFEIQLPLK
jgi:signal transduction histidine kinase